MLQLDNEVKQKIVEMYNAGVKPTDIGRKLGIKYHQPIYNFLQKEGIFVKHRNGSNISRKYEVCQSFFDVIDTEEKAYILGFISADGFVDEKHNRIVISLNAKDVDILHKIKRCMNSSHPIRSFLKDGKYNHCILAINSVRLVTRLVELGVYQRKSKTLSSECYEAIPTELRVHFLRGYFEGDGHVTYGREYSSGVKYLVTVVGTQEFLSNTFKKAFPSKNKIFKYKTCEIFGWRLSSKHNVDNFLACIYSNATIFLARKYAVYSAHIKPGELLETQIGQSAAEPLLEEGSETIEKQPQICG